MNANDTQPVLTNLAASMTPREIVHELDKHIIGHGGECSLMSSCASK